MEADTGIERDAGPAVPAIKRVMTEQGNKVQRLLRVDQIYSRKDRQIHFVKTSKVTTKLDRHGKTALVVRRIISKQGMVAGVEIDIRSITLRDIFLEIFKGVEGLELNKTPPMAEPRLFFHARPHLISRKAEEKQKPQPDQSLINDIGTALRFVEEDFAGQTESLKSLLAQNEITYDLLWAIFAPKSTIFAPKHGLTNQPQALYMTSATYTQNANGSKFFALQGRMVTHDGQDFGLGFLNLKIDEFEGCKKITSLSVLPFDLHPEHHRIRQELIDRGRKYMQLIRAPQCKEYTALSAVAIQRGDTDPRVLNCQGRVMLDPEAFRKHSDESRTLMMPWVNEENFLQLKNLTDDQLLTCAHWINGFSFSQKAWAQFSISAVEDVVWNREAFKKLVIDEKRRKLIHALVKAHHNDEAAFDDIVQNKGKGLVGLLSGSPGVGKTLTAEAVAEVTERPLYVVSSGELGMIADQVDIRLDMILEITRRWGCVLLIDEADVFLAARGTDLARDTLVSIFLRRLEYFRGVLILTTNRHSEIDSAFQSRIHFTIHYPDLDEKSRIAVWKNFIGTVQKTPDSSTISEEDIMKLAKRPLNGRQIKNAVSCAVSLAREDKVPVSLEHIESMFEILLVS